jgi:hypothetical protein
LKFEICGPYELPRVNGAVGRTPRLKNEFWEKVDASRDGLSTACGCYLFCLRGVVRYIGKAEKQSFKNECLTNHKLLIFNESLREVTGRPMLLFISKMTGTGRFATPSVNGHKDIAVLENLLIGLGLAKNKELKNISGTALMRGMQVPGVLNTQRGQTSATSVKFLRKSLGI